LNGWRNGEMMAQRPEYTGGIGAEGVVQLQKFVRAGGTLIALDTAADLPREFFPLPGSRSGLSSSR
jgi:hypothetical protein